GRMYCTAGGRVWLAWLGECAQAEYFARNALQALTPYTQTDPVLLQAELQRVKAQGFCIVDQEYEIGMRVLGVPLLDRAGQLQATLTITTHASRLSMDEIRLRYLPALYEAQALLRPVLG
ncbi:IclR family transcriptional regulator domain-containing protein, partial [Pseudomonas juntendi]|uniref:IclR family transcriptional regulator domain-containing protein n=1 Tax=Pseudomonas juntendi TaxID=2666183 RepID=UPI0023EF4B25